MGSDEKKRRSMTADELSVFSEQIALILKSGLSLYDGIEALSVNYRKTAYADEMRELSAGMAETGSLTESMSRVGIFPVYMVEMTRIGEKTGSLEKMMNGLCSYYMRQSRMRSAVKNAVTYPLALLVMMVCVIVVMLASIIPIFEKVYNSLGMEMDAGSATLMRFGMGAGKYILALVGLCLVFALALLVMMHTKARGRATAFIDRAFPAIRRLRARMTAVRFATVMSMMLGSGYPIDEALLLMERLMEDGGGDGKLAALRQAMDGGASFPDAMEQAGIFDELHARMIRMGHMAGETDSVMNQIASIYEEDVDDGFTRLIGLIEPSLVALLSIVIGALLLSVMLPMANIISAMF